MATLTHFHFYRTGFEGEASVPTRLMSQFGLMERSGYNTKKKCMILSAFLMVMLLAAMPAIAQDLVWKQTNGPYGGDVREILATPDGILYIGTISAGVFRSQDRGDTWTPINTGLANHSISALDVTSLVLLDTRLYAGTSAGVFRSEDGGNTWTEVNEGLTGHIITSLIVVEGKLYAGGVYEQGVSRLEDGGNTWTAVSDGLDNTEVEALAALGTTLYAGTEGGVFRSEDGGGAWTEVNEGLTSPGEVAADTTAAEVVLSLAVWGTTLFAGTANGVFRSDDGGESWTGFGTDAGIDFASTAFQGFGFGIPFWLRLPDVPALAVLDSHIYAGTAHAGLFRSEDGNTWSSADNGLPRNTIIRSLGVLGTTLFAGTEGDGVFRSDDGGRTWRPANTGLTGTDIRSLGALGTTLYASTQKYDQTGRKVGGVFRSEDGGNTWTEVSKGLKTSRDSWYAINEGFTTSYTRAFAALGKTVYVGTQDDGVFRSEDRGNTWTEVNEGLPDRTPVLSMTVVNNTLYAGTRGKGVFRSEDRGNTWTEVNEGLTNRFILSLAAMGATLYACTGEGVFRSEDGGDTWARASEGLSPDKEGEYSPDSIAVSGTTLYVSSILDVGVFRSEDRGNTWTPIGGTGLTTTEHHTSLAVSGKTLYAGSFGGGVFRSEDKGDTWAEVNEGLTHRVVRSLVVSGTTLYAGTLGGGVFRASIR